MTDWKARAERAESEAGIIERALLKVARGMADLAVELEAERDSMGDLTSAEIAMVFAAADLTAVFEASKENARNQGGLAERTTSLDSHAPVSAGGPVAGLEVPEAQAQTTVPAAPPAPPGAAECCASGRCEVCCPGSGWSA